MDKDDLCHGMHPPDPVRVRPIGYLANRVRSRRERDSENGATGVDVWSPIKTPSEIDVKSKPGVKASESRAAITMRLYSDQGELHRVICNVEGATAKSLIA